jgi:hypothetical protein
MKVYLVIEERFGRTRPRGTRWTLPQAKALVAVDWTDCPRDEDGVVSNARESGGTFWLILELDLPEPTDPVLAFAAAALAADGPERDAVRDILRL